MANSFASIVVAVSNIRSRGIGPIRSLTDLLDSFDGEWELILVDNGSTDGTTEFLGEALASGEIDNSTVLQLSKKVDEDAALWVGIEESMGDFVVTVSAAEDGADVVEQLLKLGSEKLETGIAVNTYPVSGSWSYRLLRSVLVRFLRGGSASLSRCFVLSRRLVSFLQRHSQPQTTFRQLTQLPGLGSKVFQYSSEPMYPVEKTLSAQYASGMRYFLWRNPMFLRGASLLALSGAGLNLLYGLYVLGYFVFGSNPEPGWASSSLQSSGMFFLFSLVLFVLSENVLQTLSVAGRDPVAFVSAELISSYIGSRSSVNVRENQ